MGGGLSGDREEGVSRGWIRSLACHYGSRALPLANPICYRLIGQITYYYRRFISRISPRLRPLVTSPLITRTADASLRPFKYISKVAGQGGWRV